jgi:hypothetical protein
MHHPAPATDVAISVRPDRVTIGLLALAAAFVVANAASVALQLQERTILGLVSLFDADIELSAPTWFSTALLAIAAALMWTISRVPAEARDARNWRFLAVVLVIMSIDEIGAYHEYWTGPLRRSIDGSGLLYASWVVPAAVLVLLIGLTQIAFLRRLHRPTAVRLVASGAIFVTGALGVESLGASYAEANGTGAGYLAHAAVEEALEMVGSIGVIRALLKHLEHRTGAVRLELAPAS